MLDIGAAFWLGFGASSGPPEALQALQGEIALADSWMGYGLGGTLARTNPMGKPTLFGDIAGELEEQIAAILLLLKDGRRDEIGALIEDAVKAAAQNYHRAEKYSGHVWRGIWVGANAARQAEGRDGPVRWVLDIMAHHCHECPIYGADPPGREYPSMRGRCYERRVTRCRLRDGVQWRLPVSHGGAGRGWDVGVGVEAQTDSLHPACEYSLWVIEKECESVSSTPLYFIPIFSITRLEARFSNAVLPAISGKRNSLKA